MIDAFIDWRCDPERSGTMKQWAEDNGIPYATVHQWSSQDPSIRAIIERRLGEFNTSPERLQEIVTAMWDKAKEGDTRAAQLYLQYVERIAPVRRLENTQRGASEMTDEEVKAALEAALASG